MEPTARLEPSELTAVPILLTEIAGAVHAERDLHRVVTWVLTRIVEHTGAEAAGAWLTQDGTPTWITVGSRHFDPSILDDPRIWPALRPAVFDGTVVHLDERAGEPGDLQVRRLFGGAAVLAVPIPFADSDEGQGAIVVVRRDVTALVAEPEAVLQGLAANLAVAVSNLAAFHRLTDLEASQRGVVRQLQQAVFTPAPTVPHTELGMHYVASDESAPTGGDLFDWVVLPDGNLHVAVVDVMGKGVGATKDALAVTHALRLLVLEGCPLEDVVRRADDLASAHNPELVATVVVARYDPETGVLKVAGGGHPPALFVHDGAVSEIRAPGIPIGWPGAGSFSVEQVTLERADTVILYTDGLIESTKDIVQGLEDLTEYARETVGYPAPNLARALVERALRGVARHDDSLALVLRRRTPPPQRAQRLLGPFEHRFSPSAAGVTLARHLLDDWLVRLPVEGQAEEDILLMAGELCANAVRHASGLPGSVVLRAWASGADVVIEVEDDGGDMEWPETFEDLPDLEAEQGRGLFLVGSLSDDLSSESWSGHTAVRAVKRAVIGSAGPPLVG